MKSHREHSVLSSERGIVCKAFTLDGCVPRAAADELSFTKSTSYVPAYYCLICGFILIISFDEMDLG